MIIYAPKLKLPSNLLVNAPAIVREVQSHTPPHTDA